MSMTRARERVWMVWLDGVVSSVDASGRDAGVALTSLFALSLFHKRLQGRVRALRGNPSDDAVWGGLEILGSVHEHGDVDVHLGAGVHGRG